MKGLRPILGKEISEQIRTYKFLIVGGVFLFFGITTPVMLKYLPEILKLAGEDLVIEIPPPTAIQSLAEYSSTIGQLGLLLAVLMAMGSIANELRNGTAIMTLSKPVSRGAFATAKLIALSFNFSLSVMVASVFAFIYTVLLIGSADLVAFVLLNLLLILFLVFCLSVTLLFSSLFKSSLAAGGLSIGILIALAGLAAVPVIGDYMPSQLLTWGTGLLGSEAESYWGALGVTLALTGLSLYFTRRILSKKDL